LCQPPGSNRPSTPCESHCSLSVSFVTVTALEPPTSCPDAASLSIQSSLARRVHCAEPRVACRCESHVGCLRANSGQCAHRQSRKAAERRRPAGGPPCSSDAVAALLLRVRGDHAGGISTAGLSTRSCGISRKPDRAVCRRSCRGGGHRICTARDHAWPTANTKSSARIRPQLAICSRKGAELPRRTTAPGWHPQLESTRAMPPDESLQPTRADC
jgi:hypothetical protein